MDENKDDTYYLKRIVKYIDYILEYMKVIKDNHSKLKPNDQNSDGVIYKFIQLREESKNLSHDFLISNPKINSSVQALNGFRNRLTHDYDNVSYSFFDEIIDSDLPLLKTNILKALKQLDSI